MTENLNIGTCGWSYKGDWDGVFYPPELKQAQYLAFYSQVFPSVEIDSSFYHIPSKNTVQSWASSSPDYFSFAAKLNREITHKSYLDLDKCLPAVKTYLHNFAPMERARKMQAHLLQLPPSFKMSAHFSALETFLGYWNEWRETSGKGLCKEGFSSKSWRLAVEFRHKSWMQAKTFELLERSGAAYCAVIEPILPPRMDITRNDLFYLRFHGYSENKPFWNYHFSDSELTEWANILQTVFEAHPRADKLIYFNNHFSGNAVKNAADLMPKLGIKPVKDPKKLYTIYSKKPKVSLDRWLS